MEVVSLSVSGEGFLLDIGLALRSMCRARQQTEDLEMASVMRMYSCDSDFVTLWVQPSSICSFVIEVQPVPVVYDGVVDISRPVNWEVEQH